MCAYACWCLCKLSQRQHCQTREGCVASHLPVLSASCCVHFSFFPLRSDSPLSHPESCWWWWWGGDQLQWIRPSVFGHLRNWQVCRRLAAAGWMFPRKWSSACRMKGWNINNNQNSLLNWTSPGSTVPTIALHLHYLVFLCTNRCTSKQTCLFCKMVSISWAPRI